MIFLVSIVMPHSGSSKEGKWVDNIYNFDLLNDEEIKLIDDNVLIYKDNKLYTFIITNKRLLVLDYPSGLYNSMEDLRISGKMNYIRMKEIIFERNLDDIKLISNDSGKIKISFMDDNFIEFKSDDVYKAIIRN